MNRKEVEEAFDSIMEDSPCEFTSKQKVALAYLGQVIEDQNEALERIAYPAYHPDWFKTSEAEKELLRSGKRAIGDIYDQRNWMASVASNAITNAGKDKDE